MKLRNSSRSVSEYLINIGINAVSIWGRGKLSELLIEELKEKVKVVSIIESKPKDKSWKNIPLVSVDNIPDETKMIIVIPVYDMEYISMKCSAKVNTNLLIGFDELLDRALS
jgi:hypothetical protein